METERERELPRARNDRQRVAKKFVKERGPGREQKEGEEVLNNAVKLSGTGLSERRRNN